MDVSPEIEHEYGESSKVAAARKEQHNPLGPLRPNPHNLRITYELFNRLREGMFLAPLCVGIGRGAADVLSLREGDAILYESDDGKGCVSPDGSGWTADAEKEEEDGPEYDERELEEDEDEVDMFVE